MLEYTYEYGGPGAQGCIDYANKGYNTETQAYKRFEWEFNFAA